MIHDTLYYILSGVLILGIMLGLAWMSKVKTAARGNLLSALSLAAAVPLTLLRHEIITQISLSAVMLASLAVSLLWARRIKMIAMPQTVALLNGFGGGASALVGIILLSEGQEIALFSIVTSAIAIAVGLVTLSGSLIAVGKLSGRISQKPVVLSHHSLLTAAALVLTLVSVGLIAGFLPSLTGALICVFFSCCFGAVFAIRVGGADMPITISLLNSLSGVAVSAAGMATGDPLLTSVGGIVGAAGLVLTQIMCRAMNRRLSDILLGKTAAPAVSAPPSADNAPVMPDAPDTALPGEAAADYRLLLRQAKRVIIVPGYGMALAQAQTLVKELMDALETRGAVVDFAIHPVAGRMPGHMNVLLAEADIPYEKLRELDEINPEFTDCDIVIVIGANDVINTAARDAVGTPIYGLPILEVDAANHVIICNYDDKPGYAGVDNPLYHHRKATLLQGDAAQTLKTLIGEVTG